MIGGWEIVLILFVVLLLFGGKRLPEFARSLGKGIREFKEASQGISREVNAEKDQDSEDEKKENEVS